MDDIIKALEGNKQAAGRIIKLIEDHEAKGIEAIKRLYPHTGNALVVGITGPPGAGKSTLIDCLISEIRKNNKKVAVLAIDPSSPITGGALLGDRIRMKRHYLDPGVFIRSIATRGALGGVSWSTKGALIVFDAMKYDVIFVETAGVGQLGADISLLAHMTLVLCIPGMGDGLQALKAGNMEIADLFIVNKADMHGADEVVNHLHNMINLRQDRWGGHQPKIIRTVAAENKGIGDVISEIDSYHRSLKNNDPLLKKMYDKEYHFLKFLIKELAADRIWHHMDGLDKFQMSMGKLKKREKDPYSLALSIIEELVNVP